MRHAVLILVLLPLLANAQEPPRASKQTPPDQPPTSRLDLYGDPLPEGALARLGTPPFGGTLGSRAVAFHPDGSVLAVTGRKDTKVTLWDISTGDLLSTLSGHLYEVLDIEFSPDGRTLATLDRDHYGPSYLWQWDLDRGTATVLEFPGHRFETIVFSPDSRTIALAGGEWPPKDEVYLLLDTATGEERLRLTSPGEKGSAIAFSPDGAMLATGGSSAKIPLWDPRTGDPIGEISEHLPPPEDRPRQKYSEGKIGCLSFSPDGKQIAAIFNEVNPATGDTSVVHLWNVSTGKEILELGRNRMYYALNGRRMAFSPDGSKIARGDEGAVGIWDLSTGEVTLYLHRRHVLDVTFSPDSKVLAFADGGGPGLVHVDDGRDVIEERGHHSAVKSLAISLDGSLLASGAYDHRIRIWDLGTSRTIAKVTLEDYLGGPLAFSADGKHIVATRYLWRLQVWNHATGRVVADYNLRGKKPVRGGGRHRITCHAFSRDGTRFAAATTYGKLRWWDLAAGTPPVDVEAHDGGIVALAFAEDGESLDLWGADGEHLKFRFDWEKAAVVGEGIPGSAHAISAYSPLGDRLALGSDTGNVVVRNLKTRELESQFRAHITAPNFFSFSADASRLVTGTKGHFRDLPNPWFRVWDPAKGTELMSIPAAPASRNSGGGRLPDGTRRRTLKYVLEGTHSSAAISPDGRVLAGGGADGKVTLWEVVTGAQLHSFPGHEKEIEDIEFLNDGAALATASVDRTLLLWDVARWTRPGGAGGDKAKPRDLDRVWRALAEEDAVAAWDGMWRLVSLGDEAVAFLRERIEEREQEPSEDVRALVEKLDDPTFDAREGATAELRRRGAAVELTLRRILREELSPEARNRLGKLVRVLDPPFRAYPNEKVRLARVVRVLEWIQSESAVQVLRDLAGESNEAFWSREAGYALYRVSRRGGVR